MKKTKRIRFATRTVYVNTFVQIIKQWGVNAANVRCTTIILYAFGRSGVWFFCSYWLVIDNLISIKTIVYSSCKWYSNAFSAEILFSTPRSFGPSTFNKPEKTRFFFCTFNVAWNECNHIFKLQITRLGLFIGVLNSFAFNYTQIEPLSNRNFIVFVQL